MGKLIDRDVLVAHLERMMAARQIDRLPRSGYAKAIEDVAGCPTVEPGADREKVIKGLESLHKRLLDAAEQDGIAMLDANIVSDALALLKAEPKREKMDGDTNG